MLTQLTCSNCGSASLKAAGDGRLTCDHCGTRYEAPRNLCANCGQVNAAGASYCDRCGERLTYTCRVCGHANWAGAEMCARCGRPLDILEAVARTGVTGLRERLMEERESANALKALEESASQARMDKLWAKEAERQSQLEVAAKRRRAEQTALIQMVVIAGVALVLFTVGVAAVMLLR